jgi:hypothetical protein
MKRNNRYRFCCRRNVPHDGVRSGYDHIWIAGNDLADQIGITLMMPLGGITFDVQIFSFDITQTT